MPDIDLEQYSQQEASGARGGDDESPACADPLLHPYGPKGTDPRGGALRALRRPPAAEPGAKWLTLDPFDTMSRAGAAGTACISDLDTEHAK